MNREGQRQPQEAKEFIHSGDIFITTQLQTALRETQGIADSSPITIAHLLDAFASNPQSSQAGYAFQIINRGLVDEGARALSPGMFKRDSQDDQSTTLTLVEDRSQLVISQDLAYLILEASSATPKDTVLSTIHMLRAEIDRPNSLVVREVKKQSSRLSPQVVPTQIIERNLRPEKHRHQAEIDLSKLESVSEDLSSFGIVDLSNAADNGEFTDHLMLPGWLQNTAISLAGHQVVRLNTPNIHQATYILESLAHLASSDNQKIITEGSLVIFDPTAGTTDVATGLAKAIEKAKGGVLFLPPDRDILENRTLMQALRRKELKLITFTNGQDKDIKKSSSLYKKAHEVPLTPPSVEELTELLISQIPALEAEIKNGLDIKITSDGAVEAARLSHRYMQHMGVFPAAVRAIKDAAIALRMRHSPGEILHLSGVKKDLTIDADDIRIAVERITGIDIQIEDPERFQPENITKELKKGIIGQDEAVAAVAHAIARAKAGFKDPKRPIGSFMFLGPSGVGKTELAKVLNEFLFGDRNLITIDMSEYMDKAAVNRLFGAPPGYVGYEEGGQLTEKVKARPYSVVLFDEIEKAHPEVLNPLLNLLDEGRLTDGQGTVVDFGNTVIIMTSNVGSSHYSQLDEIGKAKVEKQVILDQKATFRPEFINRIDSNIVFNALDLESVGKIAKILLRKVNKKLRDKNVTISLSDAAVAAIAKLGYNPEFGARPLRRAIQTHIEGALTGPLISGEITAGDKVEFDFVDDAFVFTTK